MSSKINVLRIIKDHCDTLQHEHNQKWSGLDYFVFFGFPLLLSVFFIWIDLIPSRDVVGILVTALSVFAALLFNLLLLMYDIVKKNIVTANPNMDRTRLLKQIYSNIAYAILVSIGTIIFLLAFFIAQGHWKTERVITFCVYFLSFNFILTLLMILKRVHVLLSREFESASHSG